jgi:hypothetical protein
MEWRASTCDVIVYGMPCQAWVISPAIIEPQQCTSGPLLIILDWEQYSPHSTHTYILIFPALMTQETTLIWNPFYINGICYIKHSAIAVNLQHDRQKFQQGSRLEFGCSTGKLMIPSCLASWPLNPPVRPGLLGCSCPTPKTVPWILGGGPWARWTASTSLSLVRNEPSWYTKRGQRLKGGQQHRLTVLTLDRD